MIYSSSKYEGIRSEFRQNTVISADECPDLELKYMKLPHFPDVSLYPCNFVPFNIQADPNSILSILDSMLPAPPTKPPIQSFLPQYKPTDLITCLKPIDDLPYEFWIFLDEEDNYDYHIEDYKPVNITETLEPKASRTEELLLKKDSFLTKFLEIEDFIEDKYANSLEYVESHHFFNMKKFAVEEFEVLDNQMRGVFDFSVEGKELITIKNIYLKRKQIKTSTVRSSKITNRSSVAIIESNEDLKRLSDSNKAIKKSVSFATNPQRETFTAQDPLTQIPKMPLKVFANKQNPRALKLINELSLDELYIVSLDFNQDQMNSMDLIITWQTGVKFCPLNILLSSQSTLCFLQSFQEDLKKFDLVLLIFIVDSNENLEGIKVLDDYKGFLERFSIKFRYAVLKSDEEAKNMIQNYLEQYMQGIVDKKTWVYLQERVSDEGFKEIADCLNIYSASILRVAQGLTQQEFIKYCNCLGTNQMKYERLCEFLAQM